MLAPHGLHVPCSASQDARGRYKGRGIPKKPNFEAGSAQRHLLERRSTSATYECMCEMLYEMDKELGKLISHLKSIGAYERTMIIVTSDHG